MKVRLGFISNSSASSFVILGEEFERSDLISLLKIDEEEFEGKPWYGDLNEYIREKYKLDVNSTYDEDTLFVGKWLWGSCDECVDRESPTEWPVVNEKVITQVKEQLKEMGAKNPKIQIYSHVRGA